MVKSESDSQCETGEKFMGGTPPPPRESRIPTPVPRRTALQLTIIRFVVSYHCMTHVNDSMLIAVDRCCVYV